MSDLVGAALSRDFDALSTGLRFRTRERTIAEADVLGFCTLTDDWHPQHVDAAWAARSHFGERIVHGMLVVSCALGLIELDPERVVALRRIGRTVFKRPVRIGETIRVEGCVAGVRPIDTRFGVVEITCRVLIRDSVTAVAFTPEVVWRREPEATEGGAR